MNLFNYLEISFRALWANKVRSILTMLGVVIGVFSVITFLAIGEGLKAAVTSQFESFGSNLLIVVPGKVEGLQSFGGTLGASTLSLRDVEDIKAATKHVEAISPIMIVSAVVIKDNKTIPGPFVVGTDENLARIQNMSFAEGRFFMQQETAQKAAVAVLGGGAKTRIFDQESAVGKTIVMFGKQFGIVGVLQAPKTQLSFGGGGPEAFVYIPFSTAQELTRSEQIARIVVKAKSQEEISSAKAEIENIVLTNHGTDDFTVLEQSEIIGLFNDLFGNLTKAVSGIGAISLLVGGIGIMNIMFVSVTERTREIGLRKAVGATNANILIQFLTEASLLSLVGGLFGTGLAAIVTWFLEKKFGLPSEITLQAVILAAGISITVGIIFGIVPAVRAARRNPIEALRYE